MAQVVLIDKDTVREGQEIGDIVSIHDDDVELTGTGYQGFKIIRVKGYTAEQLKKIIGVKVPKRDTAFNLSVGGKWTRERPQEKEVWQNPKDDKWYWLEKRPKFQLTAKELTSDDEKTLESKLTSSETKLAILDKIQEKISLDSSNLTEAKDLNG